MQKLLNKVAFITGAASGLGKEIALHFAQEGAKVIIADINQVAAEETAQQLVGQGYSAISVVVDVTDEDQVQAGINRAFETFGSLDILVSNAGVQHIEPLHQLSFKDWKRMLAIHLDGAFLTTRACLQKMYAAQRGGCIIYIGSVHSKVASKLKGPYVTAKHGLLGLCRVVAKEAGPHGIRANVICPGYVYTPLVAKQIPEQARTLGMSEEAVIKNVMLGDTVDGEFTTTADIAQTAVFLAAHETNALTGQAIVVSHGWFME